jgi:integrase
LRLDLQRGLDIAARAQAREHFALKRAKTVSELIDLYVTFISRPERKRDNEWRPRVESWKEVAGVLNRYVRPRLGRRPAGEVTRHDVAALSNDLIDGKLGKPSISNARHVRKALSGLFRWSCEAGRDFVDASPCVNLPRLPVEHPKTRVLAEHEIVALWHAADRDDLSWDRRTLLALRFGLCTMLRSCEYLPLRVDEIVDLDGPDARLVIPLKRAKKRRAAIVQPLSTLAVAVIREALTNEGQQFVFRNPRVDQPLSRLALATALRGRKDKGRVGLCGALGLEPFSPHDLRRTAASWSRRIGQPRSSIALCLDHLVKSENGVMIPAVTTRHYIHADDADVAEKRRVLDAWAKELRRIIGPQLRAVA